MLAQDAIGLAEALFSFQAPLALPIPEPGVHEDAVAGCEALDAGSHFGDGAGHVGSADMGEVELEAREPAQYPEVEMVQSSGPDGEEHRVRRQGGVGEWGWGGHIGYLDDLRPPMFARYRGFHIRREVRLKG